MYDVEQLCTWTKNNFPEIEIFNLSSDSIKFSLINPSSNKLIDLCFLYIDVPENNIWAKDIIFLDKFNHIFVCGSYTGPNTYNGAKDKIKFLMNNYKTSVLKYKKHLLHIKKKELLKDFK